MIWAQNLLRILNILIQHGRIDTDEEKNTAILRRSDGCEEKISFEIVNLLGDEGLIAGPYAYPYRSYLATDKAIRLLDGDR